MSAVNYEIMDYTFKIIDVKTGVVSYITRKLYPCRKFRTYKFYYKGVIERICLASFNTNEPYAYVN